MREMIIGTPNEKQLLFMKQHNRHIAFGGARGGGKSWAVRAKAKLMCMRYPGIRILIVRRTYPELYNNHINILRRELFGIVRYSDKEKIMSFPNGSTVSFSYCASDKDLDRLQGVEYDVIFLDEATQLSEYQMRAIVACVRAVNDYPKRVYYTCNPGGKGHSYIKRLFIDRRYNEGENPADYAFIQSLVTDNTALMEADPEYIRQLESLPPKLRDAWRYGNWNIFEGQFFEDFIDNPEGYSDRRFTHVIPSFDIPRGWSIYRSYDFGYNKPFSVGWWAVDYDGVIYRILELYGCTANPNEGVRWTPERQFSEMARIEREHPQLKGRSIQGVADPSIWDTSRGDSIADAGAKMGIWFTPGDNKRIPGWMQLHYRLSFDENGYPMMYVFDNCKAFIRTIPQLTFSPNDPEDLDTSLEDHVADEARYFCMTRPITPKLSETVSLPADDPLNMNPKIKYSNIRRVDI